MGSAMNVTGLSLDEVTRLLRLAERDVETLQAAVRKADAYAKCLEAEMEAASPECPSCLQLRRDRGGDPRAPAGQHQDDCPCGHEDLQMLAPNPQKREEERAILADDLTAPITLQDLDAGHGGGKLTVGEGRHGDELDLCPGCVAGVKRFLQDHRAPVALQDGGVAYLRRDGSTVTTQGPPLVFEATEPTPPPRVSGFTVTPTGDLAFHTGRPRYRVTCDACGEEVHEGTTGPEAMAAYHTCETAAPTPSAEGSQ